MYLFIVTNFVSQKEIIDLLKDDGAQMHWSFRL